MKKVISVLCVLMLCAGCLGSYAEDMRTELPEVTLKVKEALQIGDEYTDFSSSNYNGMWDLYWSGDESEISVRCDGEGKIYNYCVYEYDYVYDGDYAPRYPSIPTDELKSIADEFLGRVVTGTEDGWIIDDIDSSLQHGAEARVSVDGRLTKLGEPTDITINLSIDTASGSVNSFYRSDNYSSYADLDGDLSEGIQADEALELLKDKVGLEMVYYVTDSDEAAKLVYKPMADNGKYVVRASDGELIDLDEAFSEYYGYEYASDTAASMEMGGNGEVRKLTDAELEGISVYDDALSIEELDVLLRNMSELGVEDGYEITDASYYEENGKLLARISYSRKLSDEEAEARRCEGAEAYYDTRYITVDAADGKPLNLYSYYPGIRSDEPEIDTDALNEKADEIVKKYFGEISDQLQLDSSEENGYKYSWTRGMYYEYVRTHAGYPYRGNNLGLVINAETGVIDSLSVNWDDGQEFAEYAADEIVTEGAALEAYLAGFDFEKAFISMPAGLAGEWDMLYKLEYCWHLYDREGIYAVDAATGEGITWSRENGVFVYDDINGNEYAEEIALLGEYGIGFSGGRYEPDRKFTVRDALVFIAQAAQYSNGDDIEARDFDSLIATAENLGATELDGYTEEQVLSRGEFAGILACMSGYEKAAAITGIYECGFADDDSISDSDYGRIAIAYGLGLIDVDENGNINAGAELTRGEAAAIFHNLLSMK